MLVELAARRQVQMGVKGCGHFGLESAGDVLERRLFGVWQAEAWLELLVGVAAAVVVV